MAYDNTNSGALFVNDKRQNDKQPHYKGELNVEGVSYWLSAWLKKSQKGQEYISLALTIKDGSQVPNKSVTTPQFPGEFTSIRDESDVDIDGIF